MAERFTRRGKDGRAAFCDVSPQGLARAAEQLARWEELLASLEAEYGALAGELETLRREGREKSYSFREKAGRKLLDGQILALLRASSLADRLPEDGGGKP